jgi:AcrR family transcriptional regulator
MKPSRPYRLGQRQAAALETRGRVIAAAHELLSTPGPFVGFTIDALSVHAGVSRTTIFNQFGSKRGLLEALFDDLGGRGLVEPLRASFLKADPHEALDGLLDAFAGFWSSERIVIRRIRGLAALDPDIDVAVREREERRREGLRAILGRLPTSRRKSATQLAEAVAILHTLTSFETFDNLAGIDRAIDSALPSIRALVHLVVDRIE